jgi:hypothetical protein
VQILKKKYRVFFSGVLSRRCVKSFRIVAGQRVVKDMPVIVFSVRVTSQPKQSGYRDDENRRTIERIDISRDRGYRISYQGVATNSENQNKSPEPPVRFDKLVWEEVLPGGFFQFFSSPLKKISGFNYYALSRRIPGKFGRKDEPSLNRIISVVEFYFTNEA